MNSKNDVYSMTMKECIVCFYLFSISVSFAICCFNLFISKFSYIFQKIERFRMLLRSQMHPLRYTVKCCVLST